MTKKAKRLSVLTVIIVILFAVFCFMIAVPKNAVYWTSAGFMALAVLLTAFVIKTECTKGPDVRSSLYGYPIARVGAVYLVLQLLVCIFFMLGTKWFSVWPVVISSGVFFLFAAVGVVKNKPHKEET